MNFLKLSKHWLIAIGIYTAIALFITYPLIFQLTTHAAGRSYGDTLEFIWSMWWFKEAIFILGQSPSNISVLNYPEGQLFNLLPLMSQSFILVFPLWNNPVLAYNIATLLSFIMCGLGGYALCYDLTQEKTSAFLGGLIWVVFTNKFGHALGGHLFFTTLFSLPLFVLILGRWCHTPTKLNTAGLTITLLLAVTIHPTYLPYFLLPVVVSVIGFTWWNSPTTFWTTQRVLSFVVGFGTAGVITLLLLAPALIQTNTGQLDYLVERGAVGFAYDALAFFLPAPENPAVLKTPLAYWSQRIVISEFESIGYLGWLPMLLGVVGAYSQWPKNKVWLLLGFLGAILALGPLLKVGGPLVEVPIEDGSDKYPILLPYAFLGNLPLFQWSRTPGRITILLLLALSIFVSYGWQKFSTQTALTSYKKGLLTTIATIIIVLETLVIFPFPTFAVSQPRPLTLLADSEEPKAVLTLPWSDNTANLRALYWQTVHQKPMMGGRVYRDLPTGYPKHTFLSQLLLATSVTADIVPLISPPQKSAVLQQENVGWVVNDKGVTAGDSSYQKLVDLFGPPNQEDAEIALFTTPNNPLTLTDLVWVLGSGWYEAEDWGDTPGRWFNKQATLYIYSPEEKFGTLQFTAIPGRSAQQLQLRLNGLPISQIMVGDWLTYRTPPLTLQKGLNIVEFVDETGPKPFIGDFRCLGGSPLWGTFTTPLPCDPHNNQSRDLSLLIQQLQFISPSATPTPAPLPQFGQKITLNDYQFPSQITPSQTIQLHLLWQALQPIPQNYTLFVHLINTNQQLTTQHDGQPIGGTFPTSQWQLNQFVAETIQLVAPSEPGLYEIQIGWYLWPSLERLAVVNGDSLNNLVKLGQIEVTTSP